MSKDSGAKTGPDQFFNREERQDHPDLARGRRSFLRFLSAGAGSAVVGGVFGCGGMAMAATQGTRASALVNDTAFWENVRKAFVRPASEIVFNVDAGTVAPKIAVSTLTRDGKSSKKASRPAADQFTTLESQRQVVGKVLGARAEYTALTNGTTVGIMHALTALDWSQDDVIFYTDHEHPNVIALIKSIQSFFKVVPVEIQLPASADASAEEIAAAVESTVARHRPRKQKLCALVWSSPTYQTGLMLPIARLGAIARKYDAVSICDAAHLMGMASIDFSRLNVDFLSTCGHKWQCGPSLTGSLVYDPRMSRVLQSRQDQRAAKAFAQQDFASQLSLTGARSIDKYDALLASCSLWDDIGRSKIEAYSLALGAHLKSRVEEVWGADSLRSPYKDTELLSAMTSFDPFHDSELARQPTAYQRFAAKLAENYGFKVRAVTLPSQGNVRSAIRISTPLWVGQPEVDQLVEAMQATTNAVRALPIGEPVDYAT